MSQITIGGTTLNFKDSAFTGDQWEQVASWVLNGGAEGIDANAQIATEKAAAAAASAAAARNSAKSAGESASAAASSAAKAANYNSGAQSSANRAAASATNAASSERNAASSAATADSAKYSAESAEKNAANSQSAAKQSENHAKTYESSARLSATQASTYASSAAESIKHAPRINSDGKWELWDATKNAYVATEYTAIGEDGTRGRGWYQYGVKASNPQAFAWTGLLVAPKWGKGDWLYNPDNGNVGLCTSRTDNADGSGQASITYTGTLKGTDGVTPHIGDNGNWFLGETDTGVKAAAEAATHETAGIVKPGYDFDIAADGTLSLYKTIEVNSLTLNKDAVYEIGTVVTGLDVAWALNKTPAEQTISVPEYAVTIENIGADVRSTTELTGSAATQWNGVKTQEKTSGTLTVVLHVKDDRGAEAAKLAVVQWLNGVYTGAAAAPSAIDSAFIQTLSKSLQGRGKDTTFTVFASSGEYIWYACPFRYGTPTFNVGGFDGGFSKVATFDFTNAVGYTEEYQVWRSDNAGLGATTVKVS